MLDKRSGGLIPVLFTLAMLKTIQQTLGLGWTIGWQGINVADKAGGVGGDITVTDEGKTLLVFEVTERTIDRERIVSTFNTKILQHGIEDYLFMYCRQNPTEDAKAAAKSYFSQGHEINFMQVKNWIAANLATLGARGRGIFLKETLALLEEPDVPAYVKTAWNDVIKDTVAG